ncbi:MAG: zinc-dependent peptidase [Ferruginibacter sp.]
MQFIFVFVLIALFAFLFYGSRRKKLPPANTPLPLSYKPLLEQHVAFYRNLDTEQKTEFENRMAGFLSTVTIEGIKTTVEDIDRVFIGASAIIPIFSFKDWYYPNLTNILLYPEHFNEQFDMQDNERPVMGMVGSGSMNDKMILSKPALEEGFKNETDKNNTAIHEFVHLLDKMDGSTDGIPEIFLQKQYIIPWVNLMHKEIDAIIQHHSDINPYGATNKAEFFAVAAEYFFERPDIFEKKHPELFSLMENIFKQYPGKKMPGN